MTAAERRAEQGLSAKIIDPVVLSKVAAVLLAAERRQQRAAS